jgi:hypothetical protein
MDGWLDELGLWGDDAGLMGWRRESGTIIRVRGRFQSPAARPWWWARLTVQSVMNRFRALAEPPHWLVHGVVEEQSGVERPVRGLTNAHSGRGRHVASTAKWGVGHASRPRAIQVPTEVKRSAGRCVLWWRGRIRACGDPQWSGSVPGTGQALRRGVTANVGALTSEVVASRGRSLGRHGRDRVRGPLRRWAPLTASTTRVCSSSVERQRVRSGACASLTWGKRLDRWPQRFWPAEEGDVFG